MNERHKPSHHGKVKRILDMNIGGAAAASGVTAKMIRHYEAIGLLRLAERRANDYRDYGERDIHELKFIRRARRLGFSIREIGELLTLWRDRGRSSREVKRIAEAHIDDLQARVAEMQAMANTLRELVVACHGDDRPDCPILDDLAMGTGPPS
jgi:MerR family transcriptional regulator, copper efflux regulator